MASLHVDRASDTDRLYEPTLLSCVLDAIEEGELTENRIVFSRLTCCDLCYLSRTKRSSGTNLPFNVRSLLEIYGRSGRKALGDSYITPQISTSPGSTSTNKVFPDR